MSRPPLTPIQDLLYQLENSQSQLDRLQLDHSRETQFNREGQLRENALHEQLVQVKTLMVRIITMRARQSAKLMWIDNRTDTTLGSKSLHNGSTRWRQHDIYKGVTLKGRKRW